MKYFLDTNAVSALMKGDPILIERLRSTSREDVAIPNPVFAELAYGISRLPTSKKKTFLRSRYDAICREIARAPWTDEVSEAFGSIKAKLEQRGTRIEDFDVAIGAHALSTGAVLVTANETHLGRIDGLQVEDWTQR